MMGMYNILGHPHEKISRDTAKAVGIELTASWNPAKGVPWPTLRAAFHD